MIYNVKNHGAAGDGVTPDQGVIQALIDSLPASGGVIYFPTGDYLIEDISAGIEITKNNIEFRGDGPSSKIFRESPSPLANDKYLFYTPYNVMRRNLKFSNLLLNNGQIEDPNPSIMRLHAIDIRGCQGLNVEGLTIQNCGGDGIHISRSGEISNSEPLSSQHIIIRGCILESIYRIGISMTHSCSNITISGCTFKDIDDFSIKMEPGSTGTDSPELNAGLVVSHCMFEIPSSSDFSSKSIGIIGNSYFHPRQASILHNIVHHGEIQIHHAEDVLIAHNTIHERVAPPMSAENATTIFIEALSVNSSCMSCSVRSKPA